MDEVRMIWWTSDAANELVFVELIGRINPIESGTGIDLDSIESGHPALN